ncbi:hypothetical protein Y032_0159g3296 [Ancylostoma ceylanicum]|uniref:Beta-adaptin appendage C-terminal subdomain domain-containing protein n=2 Tax=Ancylostoma TaxID=29169 RepID=A0A016SYM8_9BILA|nr:hypothetical protein Y032_0159g3296 [Ancylostoma ceylanicum]
MMSLDDQALRAAVETKPDTTTRTLAAGLGVHYATVSKHLASIGMVAVKNDLDVFYFACIVPLLVFFHESGQMEKREFLDMWKEIPEQNEQQFTIQNTQNLSADAICAKLQQNNIMTVARRSVDGQELLYHSIKYTNNIFVLSELKIHQASTALTLSLKSRHVQAVANMNDMFQLILSN